MSRGTSNCIHFIFINVIAGPYGYPLFQLITYSVFRPGVRRWRGPVPAVLSQPCPWRHWVSTTGIISKFHQQQSGEFDIFKALVCFFVRLCVLI